MSRVGQKEIAIPAEVKVKVAAGVVEVSGRLGSSQLQVPTDLEVAVVNDKEIVVKRSSEDKRTREMHGTLRSLLAGMIVGVSTGYSKALEIQGVGFRAQVQGSKLVMSLGFSHQVEYMIPAGVKIKAVDATNLVVEGINKQLVGEVSARIRSFYPPEPYKGKGVRYKGEHVRHKAGKTVA